jgi:hypothetical protein
MANWYYVIGEEQHGPVGDEDIQRMVAAGDLQPDDLLWQAGMSDWVEVSEVFPVQGAPEMPVNEPTPEHEAVQPVHGAPTDLYGPSDIPQDELGQTGQGAQPHMPVTERGAMRPMPGATPVAPASEQIHPLAIASIIMAIAGFFTCVTALPAIVVGHMALAQIKREPERYGGKPLAVAGLVIGYALVVLPLLFVVFIMLIGLFAGLTSP